MRRAFSAIAAFGCRQSPPFCPSTPYVVGRSLHAFGAPETQALAALDK